MTTRRIEVVDYDPAWVSRYELEAQALREVFDDALVDVHHVGSTSVPGLQAKPTIDIVVEVARGRHIPSSDPAMEGLGYVCRGECLEAERPGTPGRFYYVRYDGVVHLTHVHACAVGHADIARMIGLRDFLRCHPEAAAEYGHLKAELASQFTHDNLGYMEGKDAHVQALTAAALRWASPL